MLIVQKLVINIGTKQDVRKDYTSRISVLEKRIEDLEKLVSSHAETIRTKDEIISMLRKKLGEVE